MNEAFLYDAVRTPRGRGRDTGALRDITPVSLAVQTLRALRERHELDPTLIEEAGLGIVMPLGEQGADLTRIALLAAGYGESVPGYQLNRFCVSGLDTVNQAAAAIMAGQIEAALGGGVESMSRVPIGSDGGAIYTDPSITRQFPYMPNGVAADLIATLEGLTRHDVDAYALESQKRAAHASQQGHFDRSLIPVRNVIGDVVLARDEAVRPETSMEGLKKLAPAFAGAGKQGFDAIALQRYPELEQIEHIHTSGNASAIVDGAAVVLVGSKAFGERAGLRPRARIRHFASLGSDPDMNLGGPVPVTKKLLARSGLRIADIDLFEVNEAFSVVPLVFMRAFDIDHAKVNVNGGAIALGHPLGATGAMLLGTLLDELERRDLHRGLVTLCAAAGQATATLIERV
ncbi:MULTISPECIES: acetyl-CoA C-acetyltransferase [Cupriavidus]|uniref:acetyl-CoA C-acetyltransferase n=1 Tax=Cupriavidus TaxID=106589 RepID=UPI00044BB9B0|nr:MULTISPECIES: acetyl-CoA C-acetyltransferase [Cupriavidus]KDP85154.1 acetyl-CoA acetyltransferase [Cupriavidus sp. SK-3]MDF3887231.1 acetyl-CoA C-acetyltransferase [Cupriavidus basilensis]